MPDLQHLRRTYGDWLLREKLLNGEIFTTLREAQVLIENWRRHYNTVIPHSSLTYRPPAPEPILPRLGLVLVRRN